MQLLMSGIDDSGGGGLYNATYSEIVNILQKVLSGSEATYIAWTQLSSISIRQELAPFSPPVKHPASGP